MRLFLLGEANRIVWKETYQVNLKKVGHQTSAINAIALIAEVERAQGVFQKG